MKEAPSFATLSVPTGPFRLRVELYWEGRRIGAFEYLVRPGRVVVPLLGPRYVEVRIERVRAEAVENLRALEPVIEHPSDGDPITIIHWYYLYYPEDNSGPVTYEVTLRVSPNLPIPPGSFPSSEEVANVLLGLSTTCLVRALNDALGLPRSLVDDFLVTPPRLPPEYALLGLTACLATLTSRYYLGLLTYTLTGAYVQEGVFGALPLGLWGLRLIAAGTGLPLPLVGSPRPVRPMGPGRGVQHQRALVGHSQTRPPEPRQVRRALPPRAGRGGSDRGGLRPLLGQR